MQYYTDAVVYPMHTEEAAESPYRPALRPRTPTILCELKLKL